MWQNMSKTVSGKEYIHRYGKGVAIIVCSIFFIITVIWVYLFLQSGTLMVSVIDVGQGDAIFIKTENSKTILIDGGPSMKVLEGVSRHMPILERKLDVVIITHADADHVTGIIPILEKYTVEHIVMSSHKGDTTTFKALYEAINKEVEEGATLHTAYKGDVIVFSSSTQIKILYPPSNLSPYTETNDASLSTLLLYGEHSFLFTGDLSSAYEDKLLPLLPRNITVYKAGHHGSKTSSGAQLLSYIKPEYAVISAGKDNKHGHPNEETLDRLKRYSQEILSTIDKGDISFISDGRRVTIETEK